MKSYKILIALVALFMISCTDEIDFQESLNTEESEVKSMSSGYLGVQSIFIDNGISQNCSRNMLIFSDFAHYHQVLFDLEELIEDHEENYISNFDHLDDNQLELQEAADGFYEYLPLKIFEDELSFCSLRRHLEPLEEAWLSQQSYTGIDFSTSPSETDFFMDDEYEATVLNPQGEVIIGRDMYKFFNGGVLIIDYQNVDIETLLTDLNNGMTPGQAVDDYRPFVQVEEEVINNFVPPACIGILGIGQSKFVEIRPLLGLRMTFRMRIHGGEAQLRSKTRAYRWTGSNWTRRRINMSAGFLHGTTVSLPSQECNELETVPDNWKKSKRRRRSRTFREYWDLPQPFPFQLQENLHTLETWHRLGNDIHTESAPFQY